MLKIIQILTYPTKNKVYEHDLCQTNYYDKHRKELLETFMCGSCQGEGRLSSF